MARAARDRGAGASAVAGAKPGPAGGDAACATGRECSLIRSIFTLHAMAMRVGDRLSGPLGLTSSRWILLCEIGRREVPPTVTEVGAAAMISVQNVSRMLVAMERAGLVRRRRRRGHGRAVRVELTARGRRVLERTEELAERFEASFLRGIDTGKREAIEGDLRRLIENLAAFEEELGT